MKAKGLEKTTKKEIKRIFEFFGPLASVNYNGMTGKATIAFDMDQFRKETSKFGKDEGHI